MELFDRVEALAIVSVVGNWIFALNISMKNFVFIRAHSHVRATFIYSYESIRRNKRKKNPIVLTPIHIIWPGYS